jgi:hypothetical protein
VIERRCVMGKGKTVLMLLAATAALVCATAAILAALVAISLALPA